eukprot:TRINITY_DN6681_c0_g1_i1.p1 TRINITY_DN6681_c0_g1~~TRINITY_DN6681_c0_g1_i1.p1  ORF type:complete len:477 (+),score=159.91 TRINITY_DN6681_c0_g1_i1:54-1484(+)
MARYQVDDGMSTAASDVSFDPYGDLPAEYTNPPPLTVPQQNNSHMPYGGSTNYSHTMHLATAQPIYISVVHPSGRTAWVPVMDGASLSTVKEEACRQLGIQEVTQLARVTPMLDDTPVDRQCMPNDTLYILPTKTETQQAPTMYQELQASQPVSPIVPSMPSTPLSMSGSFSGPSMYHNAPSFSNNLSVSGGSMNWQVHLEEKLANAAQNLTSIISQSRYCTELQHDLETAVQRGIDCSAVFQTAERMLPELILHPSGNYLVSKCFELCPSLIDRATAIIAADVRMYALHKHGSYVVEAILVSQNASRQAKGDLISALLSPTNRVGVATHDSGNFVLQKAIENCPDDLLMLLQDAVQAVFRMSTHGPKMLKKLEARISKSQSVQAALPAVPAAVPYVSHISADTPQESTTEQKNMGLKESEVNSIPKVEMKEVKMRKDLPELMMRMPSGTESWADAEDGPLSPPPMFTEDGRVPLP